MPKFKLGAKLLMMVLSFDKILKLFGVKILKQEKFIR